MKNRRELLKALPFLAAIPFVQKLNTTDNSIVDTDVIRDWKSYPHHHAVTVRPTPINIHPFDLTSLLTAVGTAQVTTHPNCLEINGVRFKVDTNAAIATDGGKKYKTRLQSFLGKSAPEVKFFVQDKMDVTNGWYSGKGWFSPIYNPKFQKTYLPILDSTLMFERTMDS